MDLSEEVCLGRCFEVSETHARTSLIPLCLLLLQCHAYLPVPTFLIMRGMDSPSETVSKPQLNDLLVTMSLHCKRKVIKEDIYVDSVS